MSTFLELHDLHKSFGETAVLQGITLGLAEGEILALLGPSGSGKTTLLRLLAGFETPDKGTIAVASDDVTRREPARRGFGMVFQHYALFPHMTVGENVAFGLESQGWTAERIAARVPEMLALVDLGGFVGRRVSEISGGQQQRVALARALAPKPRVLLLDEPLSNLDPALRETTRRELRAAVREVGITTVLVTHEQDEAFHVGDRVAVLHDGRLEQIGRPEDLYITPASRFVATFVGRASVLRGRIEEITGKIARVRLAQGPLWSAELADESSRISKTGSLEPGSDVEIAARPTALRLTSPDEPHALTGEIIERRFTGPLTYAVVRLSDGIEIEISTSPDCASRGEKVGVTESDADPRPRAFPIKG